MDTDARRTTATMTLSGVARPTDVWRAGLSTAVSRSVRDTSVVAVPDLSKWLTTIAACPGAPFIALGSGAKQNNFFLLENASPPRNGRGEGGGGGGGEQLVIKSTATLPKPVFHLSFASAPSPSTFGSGPPPPSGGYTGSLSYPLLSSSTDGSVLFLRLTPDSQNLSLDLAATLPVFPKLPNEDLLASKPGKMSRTTRVWASEWIESSQQLPGTPPTATTNPPRSFVSVQQGRLAVWDLEHCTATTGAASMAAVSDDMLFCCKPSPHPATADLVLAGGADRSVVMCDIRILGAQSSPSRERSPSPTAPSGGVVFELPGAHAAPVTGVAWNPFVPYWVATAGEDAVVHVWDVRYVRRTREGWMSGVGPVGRVEGHFGAVTGVAWSNTHATVLTTASTDRTLRTWNFSPSSIAATTLYNPSSGLPVWDDDDPSDVANAVWWDAFEASGRGAKSMVFGGLAGAKSRRQGDAPTAPAGTLRHGRVKKRGFKADPLSAWRGETVAAGKGSAAGEKVSAPLIAVVPSPTHPFVVYAASSTGEVLGRTVLPPDVLEGIVPHVYEKGGGDNDDVFWEVERKVFLREVGGAWDDVNKVLRGNKARDKRESVLNGRAKPVKHSREKSHNNAAGKTLSVGAAPRGPGDASDNDHSDTASVNSDEADGYGPSGPSETEMRSLIELCIPSPSIPADAWGVGQYVSVGAEMADANGDYNDEEEEEKDLAAVAEGFAKDVEGVAGRLPPGYGWTGGVGGPAGPSPSPLPSQALAGDPKIVDSVWLGGLTSKHRQEMDMAMLKMNLVRDVTEGKWEEVAKAGTAIAKCLEWDGGIGGMWSVEEVKTILSPVLLNDPVRALQLGLRFAEITQDSPRSRFADLAPLMHFLLFPTMTDAANYVSPPAEMLGNTMPASGASAQEAKEVAKLAIALPVGGLSSLKMHTERKIKAVRELLESGERTPSSRPNTVYADAKAVLPLLRVELNLFRLLAKALPAEEAAPPSPKSRSGSSRPTMDAAAMNEEIAHAILGSGERRGSSDSLSKTGGRPDATMSVLSTRLLLDALMASKRFDEYFSVGMGILSQYNGFPFPPTVVQQMDRIALPRLKAHIDSLYQQASQQLAQAITTAQQGGTRDQLGQVLGKGTTFLKEALVLAAKVAGSATVVGDTAGLGKEGQVFMTYLNGALVGFVQQLSVSLFRILETMDRIVGRVGITNYPKEYAMAIYTPLTDAAKQYNTPTASRRAVAGVSANTQRCSDEVFGVVEKLKDFLNKDGGGA